MLASAFLFLLDENFLQLQLVKLIFHVGYIFRLYSSDRTIVDYQIC